MGCCLSVQSGRNPGHGASAEIGGRSKGLLLVKLCREEDGFQRPEVGASLEEKEGHPALSWREGGKRSYCSCSDWR